VRLKSRATQLDNLTEEYELCARTEGKSDKTIRITTTALTTLRKFIESEECATDVIGIGTCELRKED